MIFFEIYLPFDPTKQREGISEKFLYIANRLNFGIEIASLLEIYPIEICLPTDSTKQHSKGFQRNYL